MNLFERALSTPAIEAVFGDEALICAMLRFEVELARAQSGLGIIPVPAAHAIAQTSESFVMDGEALARAGAHAGTLAIPFVKALRAHVAARDQAASDFVHYGTTSQDLLDTAMALRTKDAVALIDAQLSKASQAASDLALHHCHTPILARTLMQAAGVTSFGYKAAQWCLALSQVRQRVLNTASSALAVSLGGSIGNLASYGDKGAAVRAQLAQGLGLHDPGTTWHSSRHNWVALATDTALATGTMGKIGHDIGLMAQTEVGEVSEPPAAGRGGSSAMPHKRNPVLSLHVIAATQPVPGFVANLLACMPQAHERALGNWHAELAQWPAIFIHAHSAACALAELLSGLQVDVPRCRHNIDTLKGVIFAEALTDFLSADLGKAPAQALVTQLCEQVYRTGETLEEVVLEAIRTDARLGAVDVDKLGECFSVDLAVRASAGLVEGARRLRSMIAAQ